MEASPVQDQIKQLRFSLFINLAMVLYGIGTFISAIQTHVVWRIFCSGIGSVFFIAVIVVLFLRMNKLRKTA